MNKLNQYINDKKVYFIAEIGQNHQGDIGIAKQMVDEAAKAGVQAVKTVKRDLTVFKERNEALWNQPYENPNSFGKTYGEHRTALELSQDDIVELKHYTENIVGLDFICSFTDASSMFWLNDINLEIFKVPSQRLTDYKLITDLASIKRPTILSTGMSTMKEIQMAVRIMKNARGPLYELYLLQCTSCYPCAEKDINLQVIQTLRDYFKCPVGFSGHHIGVAPDVAAAMLGACIIERHFTLCRAWKGTDHAASLEPKGLDTVVRYVRQAEMALGSSTKELLDCEISTMEKLRSDLL